MSNKKILYEKALIYEGVSELCKKTIEAYVSELEQKCDELEKEKEVYRSCLEYTEKERDALKSDRNYWRQKYQAEYCNQELVQTYLSDGTGKLGKV